MTTDSGTKTYDKIYIDGARVPSAGTGSIDVINASTEAVMATIPEGTAADVDAAVATGRVVGGMANHPREIRATSPW